MKVSIIIPIYNVEKYLERCLNSLIEQTYHDFELICVDDGSTDSSSLILEKYTNDPRVRIITQKNQGLSSARNTGLRYATGDFITFIDSDDWVNKDYLKTMLDIQGKEDADIVCVDYIRTSNILDQKCNNKISYTTINEKAANILFSGKVSNFAWGKLFRANLILSFDSFFPEGKRYEDIGSIYKAFDKAKKIVLIDKKLYYYYINPKSITSTRKLKDVEDKIAHINGIMNYNFNQKYVCLDGYIDIKCFGILSDLTKIKDCSEKEKKLYIKQINMIVNQTKLKNLYYFPFKLVIRILLVKMKIAYKLLKLKN